MHAKYSVCVSFALFGAKFLQKDKKATNTSVANYLRNTFKKNKNLPSYYDTKIASRRYIQ